MPIHPTAIIDRLANIDSSAIIGPFTVIEGPASIGANVRIHPHVHVCGRTTIGAGCDIHAGAVIGDSPQDFAYKGADTEVRIGQETILREGVTVHRATDEGGSTTVGARCYLMSNAHVAHNCHVDDEVKFGSGALLGGHVLVGKGAFISGNAAVHQFVRIGELVMVAGLSPVSMDLPPFCMCGRSGRIAGVNVVGMRRAGMTKEERDDVRLAYRTLYRSGQPFRAALEELALVVKSEPGRRILEFVKKQSRRGIAGIGKRRATESQADE